MPSLEASLPIRCEIERAFDFLTLAENITKIVPPELRLRVVQSPPQLELNSRFEVEILGFGPPQNVVYEISGFERPHRFTESQVKGPLKRYIHEHLLQPLGDGTVLVTDRIEFEPPGGLLGYLITAERVRTSLEQGLAHRHLAMKTLLEGT